MSSGLDLPFVNKKIMTKLILHIPHSSNNIPFTDGYLTEGKELESEILKLTDWHTEDLFDSPGNIMVVADFSRVFCDPERFESDDLEIMAQFGMGVIYTKTDNGKTIREVTPVLREKILTDFYRKHHDKLTKAVQEQLSEFSVATIIDCHSFSDIPFIRDLNQNTPRPDFNIGTDPFHTPEKYIQFSIDFFKAHGYTLGVDWPYMGTMVPGVFYNKDNRVKSIMLEVNRKLYLREDTNKKSENYPVIKNIVQEYIEKLQMI
jgi:N-formylglutamate deformylase